MAKRRLSARKKSAAADIARERIGTLLQLAKKMLGQGRGDIARRYCSLARKIQLRHRVRLPYRGRLEYCKKCFTPWVPGRSVRVRLNSDQRCIEYACACGHKKKIVY